MAKSQAPATRDQALRIAQRLGCYGAHQHPDGGWMPCASHDEMEAVIKNKKSSPVSIHKSELSHRALLVQSKSAQVFKTRAEAVLVARQNGCSSIRTIMINGDKFFTACSGSRREVQSQFEDLEEAGVAGIDTLPSGGLVSKKSDDVTKIDSKGFVNFVSRSTDPDVFTNPDSARVRARQLGCIGIRSYTARDGKTVWLPCTNNSDYNKYTQQKPTGRSKKGVEFLLGKVAKRGAKTPAPKKDRIFGSGLNPKGTARSLSSSGEIQMGSETVNALAEKVRKHNADMSKAKKETWTRTNLRALKAVYRRGAGAFSTSHRPNMTRGQWAMGRVNAFLKMLSSGKPDSAKYVGDNDLLPKNHPWKKKGIGGKSLTIDNHEFFAEEIDPVKANTKRFVCFRIQTTEEF